MFLRQRKFLTVVCVLGLSIIAVAPAGAHYVFASSDMALGNLRFSASDQNAELIWTDEWFGTVTAHAHDSVSGSDDDFDFLLGNNGFITAQASTALVYSEATYGVTDGDLVAIDPSANIGATSHSDLEITDKYEQADGFAIADFDNYFLVNDRSGTGGQVEVTFELDYAGQLTGIADEQGFFDITMAGLLNLEDLAGNLLDFDLVLNQRAGTNTNFHQDYTGTLSVTALLDYGEEYWLYAEADSEIEGYTLPIPGSLLLILAGLGALSWRIRSRKAASH